jgi:hypothetical protein
MHFPAPRAAPRPMPQAGPPMLRLHAFGASWLGSLAPLVRGGGGASPAASSRWPSFAPLALPPALAGVRVRGGDAGWGHTVLVLGSGRAALALGRPCDFKGTLKHIHVRGGPLPALQAAMSALSARLFGREAGAAGVWRPPAGEAAWAGAAAGMAGLTALRGASGALYVAGGNAFGQCGTGGALGERDVVYAPDAAVRGLPPPGDDAVVAAAVGFEHVLARTASGALFAWGRGDRGQLGHGDRDAYGAAARVLGPAEALLDDAVTAMDAAVSHSAAVTASGALYVWGKMQAAAAAAPAPAAAAPAAAGGGIGLRRAAADVPADQLVPRRVLLPPLSAVDDVRAAGAQPRVVAVTTGQAHTACLTADGRLWMLGLRGRGRTFDDSAALAPPLRAAASAALAAADRGDADWPAAWAAAWGAQPAAGAAQRARLRARLRAFIDDGAALAPPAAQPAAAAASHADFAAVAVAPARAGDGAAAAAAAAADAAAAAASPTFCQTTPMRVPPGALAGRRLVRLRSDMHFCYALTDDGELWRWGWEGVPLPVPQLAHLRVADAGFGFCHGIALVAEEQEEEEEEAEGAGLGEEQGGRKPAATAMRPRSTSERDAAAAAAEDELLRLLDADDV